MVVKFLPPGPTDGNTIWTVTLPTPAPGFDITVPLAMGSGSGLAVGMMVFEEPMTISGARTEG